jgi:hypothetical protein
MTGYVRNNQAAQMVAGPDVVQDLALLAAIASSPSIQSLLDAHAERRPEAVALACSSAVEGWIHPDWKRFADDTLRVAAGLRKVAV